MPSVRRLRWALAIALSGAMTACGSSADHTAGSAHRVTPTTPSAKKTAGHQPRTQPVRRHRPKATQTAHPRPRPSHTGATTTPSPRPRPVPSLPRGGTRLFPATRIVAYYGSGDSPGLGVLGQSDPETQWSRLQAQADQYRTPGRTVLPAFELIAETAQAAPGPDGLYRSRSSDATIARYLATVRRHHGMLILDIQPGRSDFLTEARAFEKWLDQPDVGLALDPEWRMGPGQVPAQEIGSVSAQEVNTVSAWLDRLVARHHLPQKLFLLHKFTSSMITDQSALVDRRHLAEVINVDGFGTQTDKLEKYRKFAAESQFPVGLKLFYRQDEDMFTPRQVLGLSPAPDVVDYQ